MGKIEPVYKKIGKIVREERIKQGRTIEDLSFSCGFSVNYVGLVENARKRVSLEALRKIAKELKIALSKLTKDLK